MNITTGLFDRIVLQRDNRNRSRAAITGTAPNGTILASATARGKTLKTHKNTPVGTARRGRFTATLDGLPAGGPYNIRLDLVDKHGTIIDTHRVRDVLVGDVWILAGQSNMQGCGLLKDALKPHPRVRAFYMDDSWHTAREPIHNMWQTVDKVHTDLNGGNPHQPNTDWGVGPGVAFGLHMLSLTGVPQGLIACAHGGTSMAQWDPALKNLGTESLYGAACRRFLKNGSSIAGVAWYQGCSDAYPEAAALYTTSMKKLVAAMRRDFHNKNLPVVIVQIATVIAGGDPLNWNSIQEQQRLLPATIRNLATVPAIDLALDDAIHLSGRSQLRLGRRIAHAMHNLRSRRTPPIAPRTIAVINDRTLATILVDFDNVIGTLQAGSRPSGFTVLASSGSRNIFDTQLRRNQAIIRTTIPADCIGGATLHYGYGTEPYCNITDSADRSLPVFGPLKIESGRAITPFIRTVLLSDVLPGAGKLHDLPCPDTAALPMHTYVSPGDFVDQRPAILARGADDCLFVYALTVRCGEPMKLSLLLGYDGPVKAWLDRSEIYHDPDGTNPALPGDAAIPFDAPAGDHQLIIALGGNRGLAWGLFMRLERLDVPARLIRKGPEHYAMPQIIA